MWNLINFRLFLFVYSVGFRLYLKWPFSVSKLLRLYLDCCLQLCLLWMSHPPGLRSSASPAIAGLSKSKAIYATSTLASLGCEPSEARSLVSKAKVLGSPSHLLVTRFMVENGKLVLKSIINSKLTATAQRPYNWFNLRPPHDDDAPCARATK